MSIEALMEDREALKALLADYERLKAARNEIAEPGPNERRMLQESIDASNNIIVIYDSEKRLVCYNKNFRAILDSIGVNLKPGMPNEKVLTLLAAKSPSLSDMDDKENWMKAQHEFFDRALETGETFKGQRWGDRYFSLCIRRMENGYIVDTRTDITDEKAQSDAITRILEHSNQGVVFVDRQRRIEHINPAYREIMGISEDFDITSETTLMDIWNNLREKGSLKGRYEDDAAWTAFMEYAAKAAEAAKKGPQDFQLLENRYVKFVVREFDDGRSMFCVFDVTELTEKQKALEEETRKAHAAERAKSEFLANMSHEIRTPMNGVMGMAELLMNTELDTRQRTFADTILKSGEALLTIINDILDFSKIDAGQVTLNQAPFDLREAIEDVVTLIAPRVASKDLELAVRVCPKLPDMYIGDAGRIRQIVTNLVGNAVKFTDQGHVVVDVSGGAQSTEQGGDETALIIKVEDTGVGIPKEKCASIFDKFSQVDSSAARKHEGTGLGLSITSSLIGLMGGDISVDSDEGQGSVFTIHITLPVHGESRRKRLAPIDVTGSRLLIVDDNEVNRAILLEQTASWGFTPKAAPSGEVALSMLEAAAMLDEQFDIIVLDYHMPGLTGADVVARMQADERFTGIPIVMLTSVDQTQDGKTFQSLGVQAHLTKPARSSLLMETLIETLQESKEATAEEAMPVDTLQTTVDRNINALRSSLQQSKGTPALADAPAPRVTQPEAKAERDRLDILVAEDNAVNQIVFTQTLESIDVTFKIAENGKEAVALYQEHQPKLVLMDISMPEMNGIDATAAIRELELEQGGHTPIIAVTAHAMTGDREKYLDAGMDDYLSKPISPSKLCEMIEKWQARINDLAKSA